MQISSIKPFSYRTTVPTFGDKEGGKLPQQEHKPPFRVHFYNPVFIKTKNMHRVRNDEGKTISAELIKPTHNNWYLQDGDKTIGYVRFSMTKAPITGENYPQEFKDKPYLFINSIKSCEDYKGVGTTLIKEIVKESKKYGYKGRVCLDASTVAPERGTPIPFYYKFGFQSANKEKHEKISQALEAGEDIPKDCESVTLFLPQEVIDSILKNL